MKKRERYTGDPSPFFTFPSNKGKGLWYRVSRPVSAAMGWRDELVLRINHDFYNSVRDHLKPDLSYFLSYAKFENMTGLSKYYQDQSYENFYRLGLMRNSDEKAADNAKCRILNLHTTWILFWLIYHHNKMLSRKYRHRHKKLYYPDRCKKLNKFYLRLIENKSRRRRFKQFVVKMEKWTDGDIEKLEKGEWEEELLDFYELLCKKTK